MKTYLLPLFAVAIVAAIAAAATAQERWGAEEYPGQSWRSRQYQPGPYDDARQLRQPQPYRQYPRQPYQQYPQTQPYRQYPPPQYQRTPPPPQQRYVPDDAQRRSAREWNGQFERQGREQPFWGPPELPYYIDERQVLGAGRVEGEWYDQDGDGYITPDEWPGPPQAFEMADMNQDGRLNRMELAAAMRLWRHMLSERISTGWQQTIPGPHGMPARQPRAGQPSREAGSAMPADVVAFIDRDGDGRITVEELREFTSALMRPDVDEEGYVTYQEAAESLGQWLDERQGAPREGAASPREDPHHGHAPQDGQAPAADAGEGYRSDPTEAADTAAGGQTRLRQVQLGGRRRSQNGDTAAGDGLEDPGDRWRRPEERQAGPADPGYGLPNGTYRGGPGTGGYDQQNRRMDQQWQQQQQWGAREPQWGQPPRQEWGDPQQAPPQQWQQAPGQWRQDQQQWQQDGMPYQEKGPPGGQPMGPQAQWGPYDDPWMMPPDNGDVPQMGGAPAPRMGGPMAPRQWDRQESQLAPRRNGWYRQDPYLEQYPYAGPQAMPYGYHPDPYYDDPRMMDWQVYGDPRQYGRQWGQDVWGGPYYEDTMSARYYEDYDPWLGPTPEPRRTSLSDRGRYSMTRGDTRLPGGTHRIPSEGRRLSGDRRLQPPRYRQRYDDRDYPESWSRFDGPLYDERLDGGYYRSRPQYGYDGFDADYYWYQGIPGAARPDYQLRRDPYIYFRDHPQYRGNPYWYQRSDPRLGADPYWHRRTSSYDQNQDPYLEDYDLDFYGGLYGDAWLGRPSDDPVFDDPVYRRYEGGYGDPYYGDFLWQEPQWYRDSPIYDPWYPEDRYFGGYYNEPYYDPFYYDPYYGYFYFDEELEAEAPEEEQRFSRFDWPFGDLGEPFALRREYDWRRRWDSDADVWIYQNGQ